MKVVFLDFDGVLNSNPFLESRVQRGVRYEGLSTEWWVDQLDPDAVRLLNELLERTGAKVVVSSSWRVGAGRDWLQMVLERRGFQGDVIGVTEYYGGYDRSYEIADYLNTHTVSEFVVLDDNDDARVAGHFVLTDSEKGLTARDVETAVRILGEQG